MFKAICESDYKRVLEAHKYIAANPHFKKTVYLDRIEDRHLTPDEIKGLGFFEVYGAWFDLEITRMLHAATSSSSRIVFLDKKAEKIEKGTYEVSIAGKQASLYFWWAQGYPRGIIVLAENEDGNSKAAKIAEKEPWDWTELMLL